MRDEELWKVFDRMTLDVSIILIASFAFGISILALAWKFKHG